MRKMVLSLLLAGLPAVVSGQTLAPHRSFSIEAKEVATRKKIDRQWESGYGSYDRDFTRSKTLSITVKNFSNLPPGECVLQVFWIARNLATKEPFVHDAGSLKMTPGKSQTYTDECKELPASVLNLSALGERYVKGAKLDGWVVLITRDSEVLTMKASSSTYVAIFADPVRRDQLLATTPEGNELYQVRFRWN